MLSNEDNASVIRAIVGASAPITSPLSALSVRRIVIPNEAWVALLQIAYGYTVLLLVLLFGFSIRSRFRLT
jgi:hypothetical protein